MEYITVADLDDVALHELFDPEDGIILKGDIKTLSDEELVAFFAGTPK